MESSSSCFEHPVSAANCDRQSISKKNVKTRRGRGHRGKSKCVSIFGNNINGLVGKWDSLESVLKQFNLPSCVFIQETMLKTKLSKKLLGYKMFDKPIRGKESGGLMTAIDVSLSPVEVPYGIENSDFLVVDITVGNMKIRTINSYGPQETDTKQNISDFWVEFENQIVQAKLDGRLVLVETDANAKLGWSLIPNDPNEMSNNGKLLRDIIVRQNLYCLNADPLCEGTVTRHRKTVHREENAVLDYLIVCKKLSSSLKKMTIDDKRQFTLTKYASTSGIRMKKVSDHNPIYAEFNIYPQKSHSNERIEIFEFRNPESQAKFTEITESASNLSKCFDGDSDPQLKAKRFFNQLENVCCRSFKKIRISNAKFFKNNTQEAQLLSLKNQLVASQNLVVDEGTKEAIRKKIIATEIEISRVIADRNAKIVSEQYSMCDTLDGKFSQLGM